MDKAPLLTQLQQPLLSQRSKTGMPFSEMSITANIFSSHMQISASHAELMCAHKKRLINIPPKHDKYHLFIALLTIRCSEYL